MKVPSAKMNSKTSRYLEPRLAPWNYKKWGFECTPYLAVADEFDMQFYINSYEYDLRELDFKVEHEL